MNDKQLETSAFDSMYILFAEICNKYEDNGTTQYRLDTTLDLLKYIINYAKLLQISAVNKIKGKPTLVTNFHLSQINKITMKINDKIAISTKSIIDIKKDRKRTAVGLRKIQAVERYFYKNISKDILSYMLLDRSVVVFDNGMETIEWLKYIDMVEHMIIIFKKNLNFIV